MSKRKVFQWSSESEDEFRRLYIEVRMPVEEMALVFGMSKDWVKIWVRKFGLSRPFNNRDAWNKGLTKHDHPGIASQAAGKLGKGNPMAGARPWNKGRSYENVKLRGRAKSKSHRAKLAAAKRNKCGPMSNAWKGGPGPEHRYRKRKGKYYHRWLAEEILQRKLDTDDHVHHIDRNRHNNSPENLVVLKSEDHLKLHRKIGKNSDIDQLAWLIGQDIKFEYLEEVYEKSGKSHAA